jgi:hypothetical protein
MTRLLFGAVLSMAIGCTSIQPVGPLAGKGGSSSKGDPKADKDAPPPDPVVIPAPKPTPPMCLVHPQDVTPDNVDFIQKQVSAELEADTKSMRQVPAPAEVSKYKDGVKQ